MHFIGQNRSRGPTQLERGLTVQSYHEPRGGGSEILGNSTDDYHRSQVSSSGDSARPSSLSRDIRRQSEPLPHTPHIAHQGLLLLDLHPSQAALETTTDKMAEAQLLFI